MILFLFYLSIGCNILSNGTRGLKVDEVISSIIRIKSIAGFGKDKAARGPELLF